MEYIRGLHNLQQYRKDCVATIGNFDGVHLGHQKVLEQLKKIARETSLISTVVIFEPQPIEFFSPGKAPSRLTRLREKLQQFSRHNIDRVVCLRFNQQFANLSAEQFVDDILLKALAVKELIIGDDFHFGKNRQGNYNYLVDISSEKGFKVKTTNTLSCKSERVSSTLIRKALANGEMDKASKLLGRPYRISGRVVHGNKRGRTLGFATANIELHRYFSPVVGIFSGRVHGIEDRTLDAIVYVGSRPVFKGKYDILEVHILDYKNDLYGRHLQVELLEKIRGDSDFISEEELIKQIKKDIEDTRISLKKHMK
ncbi:MAG: bifunctional riboflavin kinase/FMN adenylyltransferase [Legionellales bacterium]|nr:bifunctional riboflavin kinase/FMN adenylyltransferase [Legionellales bacterium]